MVDEGGHQMVQMEYPGLPAAELLEVVHHFYDDTICSKLPTEF